MPCLFFSTLYLIQWTNKACSPYQFHYHKKEDPKKIEIFFQNQRNEATVIVRAAPLDSWNGVILELWLLLEEGFFPFPFTQHKGGCLLLYLLLEIAWGRGPGGMSVSHCQLIKKMGDGHVCENCFKGKQRISLMLLVKMSG